MAREHVATDDLMIGNVRAYAKGSTVSEDALVTSDGAGWGWRDKVAGEATKAAEAAKADTGKDVK